MFGKRKKGVEKLLSKRAFAHLSLAAAQRKKSEKWSLSESHFTLLLLKQLIFDKRVEYLYRIIFCEELLSHRGESLLDLIAFDTKSELKVPKHAIYCAFAHVQRQLDGNIPNALDAEILTVSGGIKILQYFDGEHSVGEHMQLLDMYASGISPWLLRAWVGHLVEAAKVDLNSSDRALRALHLENYTGTMAYQSIWDKLWSATDRGFVSRSILFSMPLPRDVNLQRVSAMIGDYQGHKSDYAAMQNRLIARQLGTKDLAKKLDYSAVASLCTSKISLISGKTAKNF